MNAIEYLLSRTWPSAWKVSMGLLAGTLVTWVNMKMATLVSSAAPGLLAHELGSLLWGLAAVLAATVAAVTLLGVLVIVPLYVVYRSTNQIYAWSRQRVVEEMICSGMSGSTILDRAALVAGRWWLAAVAPSVLLGSLLYPELASEVTAKAVLIYLLSVVTLSYLGAFGTAWTSFGGGKVKLPVLGALTIVQGLPALFLMLFGVHFTTFLVAALFSIVAARKAAIYALENSQALLGLDIKARRALRLKGRRSAELPENAILAREAMRGSDSADILARGLTVASYGLALIGAISWHSPGIFVVLLVAVVAFNCYRAAGRMSQIVTEEIETSTLETIRSTPLSSETFMRGWLQAVLRPLFGETVLLLLAVAIGVNVMGETGLLFKSGVIMGMALCFALPLAAAYIGASIAGQGRSRSEMSGQLVIAFGALVAAAVPQAMVSTELFNLPVSLAGLGLVVATMCWLLGAGAKKSLNRVFLPQK